MQTIKHQVQETQLKSSVRNMRKITSRHIVIFFFFFFQTSDKEEILEAMRGEKQNVTQGHKKKQESRFFFKINASKKTGSMTLKY